MRSERAKIAAHVAVFVVVIVVMSAVSIWFGIGPVVLSPDRSNLSQTPVGFERYQKIWVGSSSPGGRLSERCLAR
jgi:hypothetical protein